MKIENYLAILLSHDKLTSVFTTMPCLLVALKQVMGPERQVLHTQYKHKYFLHLAFT